jgi:hypothetical protein
MEKCRILAGTHAKRNNDVISFELRKENLANTYAQVRYNGKEIHSPFIYSLSGRNF